MLRTLLITGAVSLCAATAAQAQAAPARPWTQEVQCLAMMERIPEVMTVAAREMRALPASTPEMNTAQSSMAKAMEDMRPMMIEGIKEVRSFILDDARRSVPGGHAAADKAFEQELSAARVRAARFELNSGSIEARQAQMEAMQAEMQRTCPSKAKPSK
jgi:hypothetical protein